MKHLLIATLTLSISGIIQAGYTVKVPLETTNGGSLPSGTVQFLATPQSPQNPALTSENWQPFSPEYTDWSDSGVTGCSNWSPLESTVVKGQPFIQTATDCQQIQTRSKQERQIDQVTLTIQNIGSPVDETQTITVSSTRTATGTKSSIEARYDESNRAFTFGTTGSYMFTWGGAYIGGGGKSISSSGYRYTASTLKKSETTCDFGACTVTHYYEITREPLKK
ncbi:hypothetical protein QUC26_08725 [Pseudomonas asiatica]|uniref:hypothetical protein n=1 Tax=Pseudomonas asiatica TaxID=2219225 RepID=UPI0025A01200|nr:hypothetical protein [Pseudomonas asiatica]WJM55217.1 hypothetical protein QUC26_08725 [Pseudomonas asiatica]